MNGASNVRLVALVNGMGFPVRRLGTDEMVLTGFPPGLNPFHPYTTGQVVPVTVVAERGGQREAMAVQAQLDDTFAGDATFSLPYGLGTPTVAPASVRMAFPGAADAALDDGPDWRSDLTRSDASPHGGDGMGSSSYDLAPPVYVPPAPDPYGSVPPMGGAVADPYASTLPGSSFQPTGPVMSVPAGAMTVAAPPMAAPTGYAPTGYTPGYAPTGYTPGYAPTGYTPGYAMPPNYNDDPSMVASGVYQPYGDGALAMDPHVADSTQREEMMRIEPQVPMTAVVPAGPTYGMAQVPAVAPGTALVAPTVRELPEDDEKSSSKFGRGALFLLVGTLLLLIIGALMLLQRSGVQSVQAALRGQTTDITAPADGRIQKMTVSEGSDVRAGQELFALDAGTQGSGLEEMRFDVEERTRMIDQTQAALDAARNLVRSGGGSDGGGVTTTTIVSAGTVGTGGSGPVTTVEPPDPARVAAAESRLEAARIRERETAGALGRNQRLFDGGALTRTDLEAARADAETAAAERVAREADLRAASTPTTRVRGGSSGSAGRGGTTRVVRSSEGGSSGSNRLSAQLRLLDLERDIMRQQTELRQAEMRLDQAMRVPQGGRTVAASSGVVSTVYRNAGSVVRAGDPVMAIETTAQPSVIAYFPFSEARLIRGGAAASVTFPAVRQTVEGRVDAIGAAALGTFGNRYAVRNDQDLTPVRIRLNGLPSDVAPGAQADASVEVGLRTVFLGRLH